MAVSGPWDITYTNIEVCQLIVLVGILVTFGVPLLIGISVTGLVLAIVPLLFVASLLTRNGQWMDIFSDVIEHLPRLLIRAAVPLALLSMGIVAAVYLLAPPVVKTWLLSELQTAWTGGKTLLLPDPLLVENYNNRRKMGPD